MRWALIVVAFVEKARSEVYAGQESFERDWPVGGVITNHTVPRFPTLLPIWDRVVPSFSDFKSRRSLTKGIRKLGLPIAKFLFSRLH